MKKPHLIVLIGLVCVIAACSQDHTGGDSAAVPTVSTQDSRPDPSYKANVPQALLSPDEVDTRIGTLRFWDGMPDDATVEAAYDNLDFMRAVTVYLESNNITSVYAMCEGLAAAGASGQVIPIFEDLMDAKSIFLTPNTTVIYVVPCMDLSAGPVVVEVPPGALGLVDMANFDFLIDIGAAGPDKGQGGKYLFLPPGYEGDVPEDGYFVARSKSNQHWVPLRFFVGEDGPTAASERVKAGLRMYPWSERNDPPETTFKNLSGVQLNTVHAADETYFEELHAAIQGEPASAFPADQLGRFAAIGIRQGEAFEPDERMQAIFKEAAAVGNATLRSIAHATRLDDALYYDDRQWKLAFVGGSHEFMKDGYRLHDARSLFHYYATGITPAMVSTARGAGTQYFFAERDANGNYLDGGKNYSITLPPDVPVVQFWSFMVYDNQTRSMLETDQRSAGVDSTSPDLAANEDGSYTVWFGPEPPDGKEGNWVQTTPGKGWNTLLRFYGPLEAFYDKSWKPGDFEIVD